MNVQNELKLDLEVFRNIGDLIIEKNDFNYSISGEDLINQIEGNSKEEIKESLETLYADNLIKINFATDMGEYGIEFTSKGFIKYATKFVKNFNIKMKKIISSFYVDEIMLDYTIASKNDIPIAIVNLLLKFYEESGFIELAKNMGGPFQVDEIKTPGNRYFKSILNNK